MLICYHSIISEKYKLNEENKVQVLAVCEQWCGSNTCRLPVTNHRVQSSNMSCERCAGQPQLFNTRISGLAMSAIESTFSPVSRLQATTECVQQHFPLCLVESEIIGSRWSRDKKTNIREQSWAGASWCPVLPVKLCRRSTDVSKQTMGRVNSCLGSPFVLVCEWLAAMYCKMLRLTTERWEVKVRWWVSERDILIIQWRITLFGIPENDTLHTNGTRWSQKGFLFIYFFICYIFLKAAMLPAETLQSSVMTLCG